MKDLRTPDFEEFLSLSYRYDNPPKIEKGKSTFEKI